MSVINCEDCSKAIDLDVSDDYAFSDDGEFLCWECAEE